MGLIYYLLLLLLMLLVMLLLCHRYVRHQRPDLER